MRNPFWILNSALLFLLISALFFIFFSRQRVPSRQSIVPSEYVEPITRDISQITIEKIYENDLFDTYKKELPSIAKPDLLSPFPQPPEPQPISIPEKRSIPFLDPLGISLRGIIIISGDDTKNRAIIEDVATNIENTYKVGDKIDDAQLLRIFSNKVVFIRSNGQQEILYLREKDAQLDPSFASITGWEDVVTKIATNKYTVAIEPFIERVPNLGMFIDLLDIITVYKQGKSVGCRIGHLSENSLGLALGLQKGDIVTQVNGIPATDTAKRFAIYKSIITMKPNSTIQATLLRNGQEIKIFYTLVSIKEKYKPSGLSQTQSPEYLEQERARVMKEKYKFAPTMQEIRAREREAMRKQTVGPSLTE